MSFEISIVAAPRQEAITGSNRDQRPVAGGLSPHDRTRLRQNPLLAALSAETFELLIPACEILTPGREVLVFAQGTAADALHIILDGRVALLGSTPNRRACILEIFGPKEGLLDPSALIDQPHPVSARTIEACRIVRLPMRILRAVMESEAGLCRGIVTLLAQHWRLFLKRLEDQKLRSAPQRLATYLVECAAAADTGANAGIETGGNSGDATGGSRIGPIRFFLTEDRRTLASHLGMTPENLSRVIGQLRPLGVSLNGRAVSIDNLARLRQFGCTSEN